MKLLPDKVGGSPKQMAILGGLVVLLAVAYLVNRTPSTPGSSSSAPAAAPSPSPRATPAPAVPTAAKTPSVARRTSSRLGRTGEDWHPTIKLPEGTDVSKIDPTIHFALLEKLRKIPVEAGSRGSVFAFGQAPPPPAPPKPAVIIKAGQMPAPTNQAKTEAPKDVPPPKPSAPPIPLKFYGYSNAARNGTKRAFFLETNGEDIDVASENEVIKNRYKVIRIGVNSVVMEDMNFKTQQTLPLVEELAG